MKMAHEPNFSLWRVLCSFCSRGANSLQPKPWKLRGPHGKVASEWHDVSDQNWFMIRLQPIGKRAAQMHQIVPTGVKITAGFLTGEPVFMSFQTWMIHKQLVSNLHQQAYYYSAKHKACSAELLCFEPPNRKSHGAFISVFVAKKHIESCCAASALNTTFTGVCCWIQTQQLEINVFFHADVCSREPTEGFSLFRGRREEYCGDGLSPSLSLLFSLFLSPSFSFPLPSFTVYSRVPAGSGATGKRAPGCVSPARRWHGITRCVYLLSRDEDGGNLEDAVLTHVQHELPAALDLFRLQCGGGGIPARNPSFSVSDEPRCNFAFWWCSWNVEILL